MSAAEGVGAAQDHDLSLGVAHPLPPLHFGKEPLAEAQRKELSVSYQLAFLEAAVLGRRPGGKQRPAAPRTTPDHARLLTQGEAHQTVREEAGSQERGPQCDVQLLRDLRLHPHEQAGRETGAQPGGGATPRHGQPGTRTYFLIFSRMSAILPKRFCVKKQLQLQQTPGCRSTRVQVHRLPRDVQPP